MEHFKTFSNALSITNVYLTSYSNPNPGEVWGASPPYEDKAKYINKNMQYIDGNFKFEYLVICSLAILCILKKL